MRITVFVVAFTMWTAVVGKCPDRSRGMTLKYKGACLEFIKEKFPHTAAKAKCAKNNGHLVTIESKDKQAWLEKMLDDELLWGEESSWIGIYRKYISPNHGDDIVKSPWYLDNNKNDPHQTSEPVQVKYVNWSIKEPDESKFRDCARFGGGTDYRWIASRCEEFDGNYNVICQYDGTEGFFTNPSKSTQLLCLDIVYIPVIVAILLVGVAITVAILYKCYKKRKLLKRRLNRGKSLDQDIYARTPEHHIKNTENNMDEGCMDYSANTNNNNPSTYCPEANIRLTSNNTYNNLNIADPLSSHDKLHHKDLSLRDISTGPLIDEHRPDYSRSVSAPPAYSSPYTRASAPPNEETCSIVMEDSEHIIDETSPLHIQRTCSMESNNFPIS